MRPFNAYHQEVGVSRHFPVSHLNSPTVFETTDGQLGMVLRLQGVAFDTETDEQLNHYRNLWNQALLSLGAGFCLYSYVMRRKVAVDFSGAFQDDFSRTVDAQYHSQFKADCLYRNQLYLVLLYRGVTFSRINQYAGFLHKITRSTVSQHYQQARAQAMVTLQKAVGQLLATLSTFKPELLGQRDAQLGYAELLQFLAYFLNGLTHAFTGNRMAPGCSVQSHMHAEQASSLYPQKHLAYQLASHRMFFGRAVEFQAEGMPSRFASMISVKDYATETNTIILDKLLQLECEFILTNSFCHRVA